MTISSLAYISLALLPAHSLGLSSCSIPTSSASYAAPSVAAGYIARIVANGLQKPRSLRFDSSGHLLVVEAGKGITALTLKDAGGACVGVSSKSAVLNDASLNHGIEISADGRTLYASNSDKTMRWAYDSNTTRVSGQPTTLVEGMDNEDHTTRTLLLSKKVPGTLLVSRGSNDNIDLAAANLESGHSQLRSFNVNGTDVQAQNYTTGGTRIAWGLRNSVGVAEHPITGGIYSVENSADNIERLGQDIHTNNPGEELNYHGFLDGSSGSSISLIGGNYGYPQCYAVWNISEIPNSSLLRTGSQFALGDNPDDLYCLSNTTAPRLTFPAHWAPLDIVFNNGGTAAYITSHGSWNRQPPSGYQLFAVPFQADSGTPSASSTATNSWTPIISNSNITACPNGCFRPAGLAWDSKGRLYMTSDSTGEIYVITADDGSGIDERPVPSPTGSGSTPTTTRTGSGIKNVQGVSFGFLIGVVALLVLF